MSENKKIKRVENNTPRFIVAPPTPSFPQGLPLQPGLNAWPSVYAEEIEELTSQPSYKSVVENGQIVQKLNTPKFPGKKFMEAMQTPVVIHTVNGRSVGPQLTFYYEALEGREDGPEPPAMLPANEKAALAIVNATTPRQKTALERWLPMSKGAVKNAIESKLHG